jgi:hypothetical protein
MIAKRVPYIIYKIYLLIVHYELAWVVYKLCLLLAGSLEPTLQYERGQETQSYRLSAQRTRTKVMARMWRLML